MKKVVATILLMAMLLSLCACAGASKSKLRTARAAISAIKKDRETDRYICSRMGFRSMDSIRYSSASATDTGNGWRVVLEGSMTGIRSSTNQLWTCRFQYVVTITDDRTILDQSVIELLPSPW